MFDHGVIKCNDPKSLPRLIRRNRTKTRHL